MSLIDYLAELNLPSKRGKVARVPFPQSGGSSFRFRHAGSGSSPRSCIIRVQKIKRGQLGAVRTHNERLTDKHSNPDIDVSLSSQNISLVRPDSLATAVMGIVNEAQTKQQRQIRKDAPVAIEYVVTASAEELAKWDDEKRGQYFADALDFLKKRHGAENVVSAEIHVDESTPHMHVVAVPIDLKTGRLTCKPFTTRDQLRALQSDFAREVGEAFGLQRGEQGNTYKPLAQFKAEQAKLHEKELQAQAKAKAAVPAAIAENKRLKTMIAEQQKTIEALKTQSFYWTSIADALDDSGRRGFTSLHQAWTKLKASVEKQMGISDPRKPKTLQNAPKTPSGFER